MFRDKFLRCFLSVVSVISLCVCCLGTVPSAAAISDTEITAPSAVLMEPSTKKILFEKNPHDVRPCASITKVMTLILVFEAIDDGIIDYEDTVVSSAHAAGMGGSDIWLEEGESMSAHEMIKAVVVASANDAAVALAEHIAGSEEEFVRRMNERAEELGMKDTVFKNCNGLDEEGHLTSAYDVALMSAELIRHEKIFEYSSIWLDYLRGGETQIVNTNKLLKSYKGITGLKTGTTSQAGSCMSATAERDGLSLVAVVLGCESGTARFSDSAKLLDYGFANFETRTVSVPDEFLKPISVNGGMTGEVSLASAEERKVLVEKGSDKEIVTVADLPSELDAPVTEGKIIGKVTFVCEGATVDEFDIFTASESKKMSLGEIYKVLMRQLISL